MMTNPFKHSVAMIGAVLIGWAMLSVTFAVPVLTGQPAAVARIV